jgi:hypothetical protein
LPGAPYFAELERTTIESVRETSPDGLVARLATTSAMLVADEAHREARLGEIRAIAREHGERFALPQLTYVFAFRRL